MFELDRISLTKLLRFRLMQGLYDMRNYFLINTIFAQIKCTLNTYLAC